jgi:hypothetical protein
MAISGAALDDILYIEARQNYIAIETRQGRVMSLHNIKSIEEKLPAAHFARVHKSFIVAFQKIDTIERSTICIGKTAMIRHRPDVITGHTATLATSKKDRH